MSAGVIRAVIGKGFGDEGKGLAVDYFCSQAPDTLVVKHNGGAQAGHTVETDGKRFVFHQLSAGSFRHSDTFWADTYYPDLYKLREEAEQFRQISGFVPNVWCDAGTSVTLVDDVLTNMLFETMRGRNRHGSCGMGINECDLRTKAGHGMTVLDVLSKSTAELTQWVLDVREQYGQKRVLEACGRKEKTGTNVSRATLPPRAEEYLELLQSKTVVGNAIEEMQRSASEYVRIREDVGAFLQSYENIVFETGQGLLLDAENQTFAPHVSASRTGLHNPVRLLGKYGLALMEAVYVTRTYVTRHGAGPLPQECQKEALGITGLDKTNMENPWQGSLRYARHGSVEEFLEPVKADLRELAEGGARPDQAGTKVSLMITHLNETDGRIMLADGDLELEGFVQDPRVQKVFSDFYLSDSRDSVRRREK